MVPAMTSAPKPRVVAPPPSLPVLGPLVIVDGDCAYFPEEQRASRTAFALPGPLTQAEYRAAMSLGMRRSGTLVYRPLCPGCRRCQPFRVDVARFVPSRSQKRAEKRCAGRFVIDVVRPRVDDEHLSLYSRYQTFQHGKDGQQTDEESYARFLVDTVADTWELAWRDEAGRLLAVGIIDVVDDGISSVYFFWDPLLEDLSVGVASALWEIDLCRRWNKPYYYLGYLVPGSRTMSYKSQFAGGEVWDGTTWLPVHARDLDDAGLQQTLRAAAAASIDADAVHFPLDEARPPEPPLPRRR
jgi:arginyl-tRNA--protein-N-Asp/Glu arginylyltransferase